VECELQRGNEAIIRELHMLRRLRHFEKWDVRSRDGEELGQTEDLYFDDEQWTVRYVVIRTGNWYVRRSVLLSPMSLDRVNDETTSLEFNLTAYQIANAPNAELTLPVSRRWEANYSGYYGFPYYWVGPQVWGVGATPRDIRSSTEPGTQAGFQTDQAQHIRSVHEVAGYHIQAQDGEIGHVGDFLMDDQTWTIRYLLVDTSNWIGGRTVLIAPQWADHIDWARHRVHVDVDREAVKKSPQYDPGADIDRGYEQRLADTYHRPARKV
jgi:sporulation protein YlmC with PRC-barrel domain